MVATPPLRSIVNEREAGTGEIPGRGKLEMVTVSRKFFTPFISRSLLVDPPCPFIRFAIPAAEVTSAYGLMRNCSIRCWRTWLAELESRAARKICKDCPCIA